MFDSANDIQQATHPFTFPFPEDVLRVILEAAVEPEGNTFASLADNRRLSVAYNLCLVNKCATSWIEPLLYAMVSLESERQVNSFSYTLKNKSPDFLSQRVRALWLFEEGASLNHIEFAHIRYAAQPGDTSGYGILGLYRFPSSVSLINTRSYTCRTSRVLRRY